MKPSGYISYHIGDPMKEKNQEFKLARTQKYTNANLIFPAPSLEPLEPPHTSKKVALAELVIISTGYHSHSGPSQSM